MLGQTRQLLLAVSELSAVQSGEREACRKSLEEVLASHPSYANLGLADTHGEVLASALPPAEPGKQPGRRLIHRVIARRAFTIGDYSVGPTNGKPAVTFGCPVLDGSNHVQAVVFATLELDWLGSARSDFSAQVPKGATWTEIDRNGTILGRYPPLGLSCGQPFPDRALVEKVLSQQEGIVEQTDASGFPAYCAFAWRDSQLVPEKGGDDAEHPQIRSVCRSESGAAPQFDVARSRGEPGPRVWVGGQQFPHRATRQGTGTRQCPAGHRRSQHPHRPPARQG